VGFLLNRSHSEFFAKNSDLSVNPQKEKQMAISTNGTVLARVAGALYNTQMSNATYKEVASLDPSALANVLYARDFSASTDAAVATTLVTNLGLSSITGLNNWVAAQLTAAGSAKGAKVVDLLNSFAQMTADTTYGAYATAFNTKVDAALALSQTTDNKGGTFAAAGVVVYADATFALTAGVDTYAGGAGNDAVSATVATMNALDSIDGGAGANTLNITDTGAIASFGTASFKNFQTVNVSAGGAVGALKVDASGASAEVQAAVAQQTTFTVASATYISTEVVTVRIGDAVYTTTAGGTANTDVATAIAGVLTAHLGDDSANNDLVDVVNSSGVVTLTSKKAGTPLPTVTASIVTAGAGGVTKDAVTDPVTVVANVPAIGPGAIKEVVQLTIGNSNGTTAGAADYLDTGDSIKVSINGVDYVTAASGTGTTNVATDVAAVINAALGTGTAVATGSVVTITAATAGTPLPYFNVASAAATGLTDAFVVSVANQQASVSSSGAVSASALAAPTGTTSYVVSSTGVANVSGAATTAINVTATAGAQTSGGSDVTVKAAGSVGISSAKGAVSATTTAISGNVVTNAGTGNDATYGAGVYVTGGTTVAITQKGAALSTAGTSVNTASTATGTSSGIYTNAIQVGVDPTVVLNHGSGTFAGAIKSPSSNTFYNAVAGLAGDPTGNVTTTASTAYTTAAGKKAVAYAGATQKAFVNGADTVSLTGVNTGTITDVNTTFVQSSSTDVTGAVAGASKLTTVNLTGIKGTTTIKSDAITTVKVVDSTGSGAVSVSNSGTTGANAGAFNLTVGNSTVSVTNATATSVNVGTTVSAYETLDGTAPVTNGNALTLVAGAATSLNFTNANTVTLTNGGLAKVAAVTASNSGTLALGDLSSGWTKLASVNAAAATGAVTATVGATPADAGMAVVTGSGNDTITLNGNIGSTNGTYGGLVTTSLNLGAGNDNLVYASSGVVGAGSSVDAGEGTDSVSALLVSAGNAAIFKGFERLNVAALTEGASYDAAILTNSTITGVKIGGAIVDGSDGGTDVGTVTISNISGTALNVDVTASSAGTVKATLATATGTSDAANVTFASSNVGSSDATVTVAGLVTTGLETLNVASGGAIVNTTNFTTVTVNNVLTSFEDTGNTIANVSITGDKALNLGNISVTRDSTSKAITAATWSADFITQSGLVTTAPTTATTQSALTLIDGSNATGNLAIYAGVTNDILVGSTDSGDLIFDNLAIKGGSGSDAIRNDAKYGSILGGAGGDWLVVGGASASANGGAGDDTLIAGSTSTTLTGGAGKDAFVLWAAAQVGSGAATNMTTIADIEVGDTISGFKTAVSANDTALGITSLAKATASTLASATTLDTALDAALKQTNATANTAFWFQYGGNTYIAIENATDGLTSGDYVVKLTGLVDLTNSTVASNVITIV
jgi:S-layer protein